MCRSGWIPILEQPKNDEIDFISLLSPWLLLCHVKHPPWLSTVLPLLTVGTLVYMANSPGQFRSHPILPAPQQPHPSAIPACVEKKPQTFEDSNFLKWVSASPWCPGSSFSPAHRLLTSGRHPSALPAVFLLPALCSLLSLNRSDLQAVLRQDRSDTD